MCKSARTLTFDFMDFNNIDIDLLFADNDVPTTKEYEPSNPSSASGGATQDSRLHYSLSLPQARDVFEQLETNPCSVVRETVSQSLNERAAQDVTEEEAGSNDLLPSLHRKTIHTMHHHLNSPLHHHNRQWVLLMGLRCYTLLHHALQKYQRTHSPSLFPKSPEIQPC